MDHMHVRKTEFATEVILSLLIVGVTLRRAGSAEWAVAAIAIIHSFNIARAIEAYKTAQAQQQHDLEDYR